MVNHQCYNLCCMLSQFVSHCCKINCFWRCDFPHTCITCDFYLCVSEVFFPRFTKLPCGGIGVDSDTVWNELYTPQAARVVRETGGFTRIIVCVYYPSLIFVIIANILYPLYPIWGYNDYFYSDMELCKPKILF